MKKAILSSLVIVTTMSVPVFAAVESSFGEQLNRQKQQLRPHNFNFHSDRYLQLSAMRDSGKLSLKQQLDRQLSQMRPQEFNPVSDAYKQVKAHRL